jgi:hypothetical protein
VHQSRPFAEKKHQTYAKSVVDVHGIGVASTDENCQKRIPVGGGIIKRNIL